MILVSSSPNPRQSRVRGFSLIELLVVMGIVSSLIAVTVFASSSYMRSASFNSSLVKITGLLETARQHAVSQNTYVWVAFRPGEGEDLSLEAVLYSSRDGTDTLNWQGTVSPSDDRFAILTKREIFGGLQLLLPTVPPSIYNRINGLTPTASEDVANSLAFQWQGSGLSAPLDFTYTVQFTPRGEAKSSNALASHIDLGLAGIQGDVAVNAPVAVVRLAGISGRAKVYQP